MGGLRGGVGRYRGGAVLVAFVLAVFVLLTGVMVALPVEWAAADDAAVAGTVKAGVADGYFSTLSVGATPVVSSGWASTRRIVFGKQGSSGTYDSKQVSGGYKTLAKGAVASEAGRSFNKATVPTNDWSASSTTSVAANEALLWADDVVTAGFKFDTNASFRNSFDSETASYKSNLAVVSDAVGAANYSSFEQGLLRSAKLEGVCTAAQSVGCSSGSEPVTDPVGSFSVNAYKVFPLSIGDVNKYFGHFSGTNADPNLACKIYIDDTAQTGCANGASGSWLRSARWSHNSIAVRVKINGEPNTFNTNQETPGLRPALRLGLDNLLLSADSQDQSQRASSDLRLTFVESGKKLNEDWSVSVSDDAGPRRLSLSGRSDLDAQSGLGWKVVDPESNTVLGSGKTNDGGNTRLPMLAMTDELKDYDLYVWGQQDGSESAGLTNKATEPVKTTIKGKQLPGSDVSGEVESEVMVTLPAGFVLDGTKAGDVSQWVGNNVNLAINVAGVAEGEQVAVRVAAQNGDPALEITSGEKSLGYELRVNQSSTPLKFQNGSDLVVSSGTPVAATLQARFVDGIVASDADAGDYAGALTFQITVEDIPTP